MILNDNRNESKQLYTVEFMRRDIGEISFDGFYWNFKSSDVEKFEVEPLSTYKKVIESAYYCHTVIWKRSSRKEEMGLRPHSGILNSKGVCKMEKIQASNITVAHIRPLLKVFVVVEYNTNDCHFIHPTVHPDLASAQEEMRKRFDEWEENEENVIEELVAYGDNFHIEIFEDKLEVQ